MREENGSKEVFRGHFDECVKHLSERIIAHVPKGTRGAVKFCAPMAKFCKVSIISAAGWMRGTRGLPVGEEHFRLMFYLDLMGYRVIELERMTKGLRNYAELVAYGLLTFDGASEALGYSQASTFYQVLHGRHGVNADKEQKLWDLWKERKMALEQKKVELKKSCALKFPVSKVRPKTEAQVPAVDAAPPVPVQMPLPSLQPSPRRSAVSCMVEGLLILLEGDSVEALSEDGLTELLGPSETVLRLSGLLSTLSYRLVVFAQRKGGGG